VLIRGKDVDVALVMLLSSFAAFLLRTEDRRTSRHHAGVPVWLGPAVAAKKKELEREHV